MGSGPGQRPNILSSLGKGSKGSPYNVQRNASSTISSRADQDNSKLHYSSIHRLRNDLLSPKQTRIHSIPLAKRVGSENNQYINEEQLLPEGETHTWKTKLLCRQSLSVNTKPKRVDHKQQKLQRIMPVERKSPNRSLCSCKQCETSPICIQIPTSENNANRRPEPRLEQLEPNIPVPTCNTNRRSSTETEDLQRPGDPHSSRLSLKSVVGRTSVNDKPSSPKTRNISRNLVGNTNSALRLSRLQFLRRVMKPRFGLSVTNTLINSHRASTQKQYQHCWSKFQHWLQIKHITAIRLKTVLEFLMHLVDNANLSPKSMLVYKSCLHLPLKYGFNISTKAIEFNLLSKSQFISNPPSKIRVPEWKLDKVLELLEQPRFLENVSDEDLLLKCLFLTALATGNRASELSAMTRKSAIFLNNGEKIKLSVKSGFLYKNERMGKSPPEIIIPSLKTENNSIHSLCPVNTLKNFLERTKNFKQDCLFFDVKTKQKLSAPRISFCLCKLINIAQPGTFPRGHDVRKLSSSLAWTRGIPIDQIIKNAFWKTSSTFISSYLVKLGPCRPCVSLLC